MFLLGGPSAVVIVTVVGGVVGAGVVHVGQGGHTPSKGDGHPSPKTQWKKLTETKLDIENHWW